MFLSGYNGVGRTFTCAPESTQGVAIVIARDRLKALVDRLSEEQARMILEVLGFITQAGVKTEPAEKDQDELEEDKAWLDAALSNWPPYDWGPKGIPPYKPVRYEPGVGLVIQGGKKN